MIYRVDRAEAIDRDLEAIFDFLFEAAISFGEDTETAFERAATRLAEIDDAMEALGHAPHQGMLRPEIAPGLRSVTKGRAIFYFDLDETDQQLRVLAVFFGGQDHQRRMLLRALGHDETPPRI
ncbi:type II toxin-antitoxin system RelE/ParE family toxin [Phaeobacter gallaeciensis]|uniref:type II toxin-antitoxin system RelE/ParE family toxin n=1 Tax=Phaeobacter gallaeciensis TaxID=60890 RepID=UPI000BBBA468|nr:type II toxin-antitoxin system RelE/ParE family toxin [Phaeobacter gallaeciensis]ATF20224.1 Plasmid stabilization system protein [Phaeobacter gallaeciensis]ATF24333.1 Plasmid stabilization system protein [Phaeobacter gallaeciensis]